MRGHYLAPRRRRLNLHLAVVRHRRWKVPLGSPDIPDSGGRQQSQQHEDVGRRRPKTLLLPEQAVLARCGRRVQNSVKLMGDGARQNRGADR